MVLLGRTYRYLPAACHSHIITPLVGGQLLGPAQYHPSHHAPSTASWEPEGEEFKVLTHKNSATRKGPLKLRTALKEGEAVGYVGWRT